MNLRAQPLNIRSCVSKCAYTRVLSVACENPAHSPRVVLDCHISALAVWYSQDDFHGADANRRRPCGAHQHLVSVHTDSFLYQHYLGLRFLNYFYTLV